MGNWFLEYEKGYLLSYINKKRIDKQNYTIIKDFAELDRLIKKEHIKGETELDTIKRMINEIREGKEF